MRKGFSLITAIIFMVLIATLGALALSLSTTTVKQTTDVFLKEQAKLLARSGTEFALLAISANEINTTNCVNQVNSQYPDTTNPIFDINVSVRYLGNGIPASCSNVVNTVATDESNLTVILDTVVETSDDTIATEPIRFHRRTIQRL